ncbi:uncharacterized protein LOC141619965 [Silene latifolia]|uniref:uncharacterized protein LOC141619965 n=1 Tax=Silene latifolia TaxID=37657 RepID=UPI003D77B871
MEDEHRRYNQTFDPPVEGWPTVYHYADGTTRQVGQGSGQIAGNGEGTDDIMMATLDEGNTGTNDLGNGNNEDTEANNEPEDLPIDDPSLSGDILPSESLASEFFSEERDGEEVIVISSDDTTEINTELQLALGGGSEMGPLITTSHEATGNDIQNNQEKLVEAETNRTGNRDKGKKPIRDYGVKLFDVPEVGAKSKLEEIRGARKRRCCSDAGDYIIPDSAKRSMEETKVYLRKMAKRRCWSPECEQDKQDGHQPTWGFRVHVEDVVMVESSDSSFPSVNGGVLILISMALRRPYKLDAWVLDHEECVQIIRVDWKRRDKGSPAYQVNRKLSRIRTSVKRWTLDKRAEWRMKWDEFDQRLEHGMTLAITGNGDEEYTKVNEEVTEFARAAVAFWKQRAKIKWMVDGDTCTKYFFNWVNGRAGRNHIHGIKGSDRNWNYDESLVRNEFHHSFMDLYLSSNDSVEWRESSGFENTLKHLDHSFSQDELDRLSRPFSAKEVRTAVFQMGALKAPGPDGIPAVFYQRCWSMIKGDFTKAILSILNSGRVLREINRTFIALIPKKENPEGVTDYTPISLCNVMMRIVTKCIANRLAKVMSSLVSETQNAFLPGTNISDNILVAHEAINKISSHGQGRQALGAFKADMSKAYDRVRWDFLEAVLIRYGFPQHLISLMMRCVTTMSYEILVNGVPLPQFKPRCGLRKGDSLSPYLFILCMEVLSRIVEHAHELRLIHGIQLVREVRPITHLFFADDSVFFFKDKGNTVTHLVQIIKDYCEASGQRLNVDKSGILFSPNTTLIKAQRTMKVFDIKKNNGIGKNLGIPAEFKESKQGIFNALIDHVTRRISSWNGIFLSPAGRLTLISSVLSNLSNYFISVFKVPVSVAKKINSILAQFWWTRCKMGHNIHWCSKNFLSLPKSAGGLGIRNVKFLNQALLAKHGWRIVSGETSLFCRIFIQKLFGTQVIQQGMTPIRGSGCSWGIRSILHGLAIVMENMGWNPGIESKLNIWTARWVGGERPESRNELLTQSNGHLANLQVRNLFQSDGSWNKDFIEGFFMDEWATRILVIPQCEVRRGDKVYWSLTTPGTYTVKSGYDLIFAEYMVKAGTIKDNSRLNDRGRHICRKMLWKLHVSQMWKILIWKIITNVLPTGHEFSKRNIEVDPFCGMCRGDQRTMETPEHLFRDCGFLSRLWAGSVLGIRVEGAGGIPISDWICD